MFPVGAIFVPFPPKTGTRLLHPRPPPIVERILCVCLSLPPHIFSVPRCKKVALLYVYEEELMFWCSLVGADRPPNKQAMPVARQEDLGLCVLSCISLPPHILCVPRCKKMALYV